MGTGAEEPTDRGSRFQAELKERLPATVPVLG